MADIATNRMFDCRNIMGAQQGHPDIVGLSRTHGASAQKALLQMGIAALRKTLSKVFTAIFALCLYAFPATAKTWQEAIVDVEALRYESMITHDLTPSLVGQPSVEVESLHDAMQWHMHYVARGTLNSRSQLWQMGRGTGKTRRACCGGIDLGFSSPKLLRSIQCHLDRGFNGVKIKNGSDDVTAPRRHRYAKVGLRVST